MGNCISANAEHRVVMAPVNFERLKTQSGNLGVDRRGHGNGKANFVRRNCVSGCVESLRHGKRLSLLFFSRGLFFRGPGMKGERATASRLTLTHTSNLQIDSPANG